MKKKNQFDKKSDHMADTSQEIPLRALDIQLAGGRGGIKGCSRLRIPAHSNGIGILMLGIRRVRRRVRMYVCIHMYNEVFVCVKGWCNDKHTSHARHVYICV